MLNDELPQSELEKSLKTVIDKINWILTQIDTDRNISIFEDKPLLAKLHHSLNIDKYSQDHFRYLLLSYADKGLIKIFLDKIGESQTIPNDLESYQRLVSEISSFPWGNNETTRKFVEVFGYPEFIIPSDRISYPESKNFLALPNPYPPLKDYQSEVFFDCAKKIKIPNQRFLIQMPTGSGKTRVAIELICHFLNANPGSQALWIADRVELCEQATETFMSVWPHVGKTDLMFYSLWGNKEPPGRVKNPLIMVTMYQKIRKLLEDKNSLIKPDIIIMDEAHNVLAPTYQKVIEELTDPIERQTRLVGLTATPGRTYKDSEANRKLSEFFNRRIVEVDSGDIGVIEYLQAKRILSRAVRKPLNTNIRYTLTPEEWKKFSKTFSDYPGELLERIANDQRRNLIISKELFNLARESKQVLFFGTSVEQSRMLCGLMLAKGYAAAHIDGNSPSGYRSDVVNKFRKGEIKFIFNYGIFATGFDAPNIDTIFIARPTTSIVLYSQMLGRGMRGPEIGGTEEFLLIDVVDLILMEDSGLDNVYEYFSDYWKDSR